MLTNTDNRDRTPNQEDDSWSDSQKETNSSFKHFKSEEAQSLDNCSSFKESCPAKKSIGLGEEKEKQDYYIKSEWNQPKVNFDKKDIIQSWKTCKENQLDPFLNKRKFEEIKNKQEI